MASLLDAPVGKGTVSVCLICGDKGATELLIHCRKCGDSAVHHYCMDDISPDDDNIDWVCWDCALEDKEKRSIPEIPSQFEEPVNDPTTSWSHQEVDRMSGDETSDNTGQGRGSSFGRCLLKIIYNKKDNAASSQYSSRLHNRQGPIAASARHTQIAKLLQEDEPQRDSNVEDIGPSSRMAKPAKRSCAADRPRYSSVEQPSHSSYVEQTTDDFTMPPANFYARSTSEGKFMVSSSRLAFSTPQNVMEDDDQDGGEQNEDQEEQEEGMNHNIEQEFVPVQLRKTRTETWMLQGPAPGGPVIINLIPSYASHTAFDVWNGQERGVLKCQSRFGHLLSWGGPNDQQAKWLVYNSGFGHLRECMFQSHNAPLLCAFVERWHPETNSFHMPFGEMTITLHDVYYILGLRLDAPFVSYSATKADMVLATAKLLKMSVEEVDRHWQHGGPRLIDIRDRCSDDLDPYTQAGGYLMFLLGTTIFIDKSSDRVRPLFVSLFRSLQYISQYAWGAAALVYLYRKLGMASRAECRQLSGCLTLFEAWIYEYFPQFRPAQNPSWKDGLPRAQRWKSSNRYNSTSEKLLEYRLALDRLTPLDVIWMPFGMDIEDHPSCCRSLYHGTIRYMDFVEPYMPDRVLRQFGYVQIIPSPPIPPIKVSRPRQLKRYVVTYPPEDVNWIMPATHFLQQHFYGVKAVPPFVADERYLEWYQARTHSHVTNLRNVPDDGHNDEDQPAQFLNSDLAVSSIMDLMFPLFPGVRDENIILEDVWSIIDQCVPILNPFINMKTRIRTDEQDRRGIRGGRRP